MDDIVRIVEEVIKHLPGRHDQKDHGKAGPESTEAYSRGQKLDHGKVYEFDQKNPMYRGSKVRVTLVKNKMNGKIEILQSQKVGDEWTQYSPLSRRKGTGEPGKSYSFTNPKKAAEAAALLFDKYSKTEMPETKVSDGRQD